jgi:hypothetical protein
MAHLIPPLNILLSPEATAIFDSISMPCHRLLDPIVAFFGLYQTHTRCMRLEWLCSADFRPLLFESRRMQVSAPSRQPPMSTPVRHFLRAEA